MATISQLYIDGIREGRSTYNIMRADGVAMTVDHFREEIASLETLWGKLQHCAYSAGQADFFQGQIDFWRNQAKKAA